MTEPEMLDVVVVGAGLAGLTAARMLDRQGRSVRVLEAQKRVGGRTFSHPLGGDTVDLGAQWIGPTQDRIAALAQELGVQTFKQFNTGRKILDVAGRTSTYRKTIPSLPIISLIDLQLAINAVEKAAKQVPLSHPAKAHNAALWDSWTVETWKQRHMHTEQAKAVFDGAVRAIFAAEPNELSWLHFLFYVHSGGGFMNLAEINNGAQQDRFIGGAQQIADRMAEQLAERVTLDAPVRAIVQQPDGVTVHSDDRSWRAQYVIVAIPPALAGRINYTPALPGGRDHLTQRMPMGSVIKSVVAYDRPFWRERGYSGEILSHTSPISLAFDDSPHDDSFGALVVFMLGDAARTGSERGRSERARTVVHELQRFLGTPAAHPIGYIDHDWLAEPWSRGCYAGLMAPGTLTAYGAALRQPIGRIHWSGTETATRWNGYMDGAIESGERAAAEIETQVQSLNTSSGNRAV